MDKIASELLVERLIDWGVDTVFGLPGDGINGIMEGMRRHAGRIRFVLVHHEEAAAFMATGYAKSTGRLGVCLATSGPGGIHLLNGLYDAKLDHAPVLALTGMQETELLGTVTSKRSISTGSSATSSSTRRWCSRPLTCRPSSTSPCATRSLDAASLI